MSAHYEDKQKISQFPTVEANAVKFAAKYVHDEEADVDHNLRTTFSQFAGPHKFAVVDSQSYGAYIRGITHPRFTSHTARDWRHELADFVIEYRRSYPAWPNAGFGAAQNAGRTGLLVNFHQLDPKRFPDEWVLEGPLARATRFMVQRRLFGIGMNTDLELQEPTIRAYTDWEFTGKPPFLPTVRESVWTDHNAGAHVSGFNPDSLHGFGDGGNDNEQAALVATHQVGNATWDALMEKFASWWRNADEPVKYPILHEQLQYACRAKDINESSSALWRDFQPDPGAGNPPLATMRGNLHLGNAANPAGGPSLRCSQLFTHSVDLKQNHSFRAQLVCSREQFEHNSLETAKLLIQTVDYRKLGMAEKPWFPELSSRDLSRESNPTQYVIKYLFNVDKFAPKATLRTAIEEKLEAPSTAIQYDMTFYVSRFLEAIEKIVVTSQRLSEVDRVSDAQAVKRACVELSKFSKLSLGSGDKLQDEYIQLFTIYADRDDPSSRDLYRQYFGSFDALKRKVLQIEAKLRSDCVRKDIVPAKWQLDAPGVIAHSALEHPPSRSARRVCRQLEKTRCALFSMGIFSQTLYPPCTGISEVHHHHQRVHK